MTNINDLYKVLKEMRKVSNRFPDDENELHRSMTLDEVIWMIESEDFFKTIENIYMKDEART